MSKRNFFGKWLVNQSRAEGAIFMAMLEEGCQANKAPAPEAFDVLVELVALKRMKERSGNRLVDDATSAEYESRKEIAWAQAKKIVDAASPQGEKDGTVTCSHGVPIEKHCKDFPEAMKEHARRFEK